MRRKRDPHGTLAGRCHQVPRGSLLGGICLQSNTRDASIETAKVVGWKGEVEGKDTIYQNPPDNKFRPTDHKSRPVKAL